MSAQSKPLPKDSPKLRTIPAGEFKAKCLQLMDEVSETKRPITVTKRGKPVGQFVPMSHSNEPVRSIFGLSPKAKLPSEKEWRKLKDELAKEWDDSIERTARQLNGEWEK